MPDPTQPPATLTTRVTYLEMRENPARQVSVPPLKGLKLRHFSRPSLQLYRRLYREVGEPWLWWERRAMSDEQLAQTIHDPRVEVHLLYHRERPIGYGELDCRQAGEVELVYLGLVVDYIGRGLGRWLLGEMLRHAWGRRPRPRRVWLHTCDLDHPRALEFYRRAGFRVFKTEVEVVEDTGIVKLRESEEENQSH